MIDTKEKILLASLRLFADRGFEAVSVSDIAGELNITKGALYKHYESKQAILDSIVSRMEELIAEREKRLSAPPTMKMSERDLAMNRLLSFSQDEFDYWTREEFPCEFRRMLTLEQYSNSRLSEMYQKYLVSGPLEYVSELFRTLGNKDWSFRAIEFYAPIYMYYSLYDAAEDKKATGKILSDQIARLSLIWTKR